MARQRIAAWKKKRDLGWALLVGGVVLSPLFSFGGVTPGGSMLFETSGLALGTAFLLHTLWQGCMPLRALRLALPLAALAALGAAQLVPLSEPIRAALGLAPETRLQLPLVRGWLPSSLNPASTADSVWILAAAFGLYAAALGALRAEAVPVVASVLVTAGGLAGAASLWAFVDGGGVLALPDARLAGPFVNPDHFGSWLAAMLPLAAAGGINREGWMAQRWCRVASAASLPFMTAALVLTLSRGAALAGAAGLAYLGLRLSWRAESRRQRAAAGLLAIGVAGLGAWAGGAALQSRFESVLRDPLADLRWPVWQAAVRAFWEAPFAGSGMGCFLEAVRRFVPDSVPGRFAVDHAHNELLQVGVEGGVLGLAAVTVGVAQWWDATRQRSARGPARLLAAGAEGGVIAILAASAADFAVRLPAIGGLALVLAAMAVVPPEEERPFRRASRASAAVAALVSVTLAAAGAAHAVSTFRAAKLAERASDASRPADWARVAELWEEATDLDPRDGRYHFRLAQTLAAAAQEAWPGGADLRAEKPRGLAARARLSQALYARAAHSLIAAVRADRTNPRYRQELAWVLASLTALEEVFAAAPFTPEVPLQDPALLATEPSEASLALYRDATALEPRDPALHASLALWALAQLRAVSGSRLFANPDALAPLEEMAVASARRAAALDPLRARELIGAAIQRGALYEDLRVLLPADPAFLWTLADALESLGHTHWTGRALADLATATSPSARPQSQAEDLARRIARRADRSGALDSLRTLASMFPESAEILQALAHAERNSGQPELAEQHLRKAIDRAPSTLRVRLQRQMGLLLAEAGELERAEGEFAALLRERPADPWAHFGMGLVHDLRDEWLDASRWYQQAAALSGGDDDLYYRLGHRYFARGLYNQAAELWERGLRALPESAQFHLWLGRAYAKAFRRDRAVFHYREALRIDPGNHAAAAELAATGAAD